MLLLETEKGTDMENLSNKRPQERGACITPRSGKKINIDLGVLGWEVVRGGV